MVLEKHSNGLIIIMMLLRLDQNWLIMFDYDVRILAMMKCIID